MIISHRKKFIFIHNYKVAGTSMRKALKPYNNHDFIRSSGSDKIKLLFGTYPKVYAGQFPGHIKGPELKAQMPKEIFDTYYKFGFVRNPWDWQVSLYTYMLKKDTHRQNKLAHSFSSFDEYIDWRVNEDLHLQKEFFYEGNECLMDYIGKMENINEDFKNICEKLDMNAELPHLNASRDDNKYLKYYSKKTVDIVNEAFREDIELFGYKKPNIE